MSTKSGNLFETPWKTFGRSPVFCKFSNSFYDFYSGINELHNSGDEPDNGESLRHYSRVIWLDEIAQNGEHAEGSLD